LTEIKDDWGLKYFGDNALFDREKRAKLLTDGIAKAIWESAPDGLMA
jgi:hypothetical protein